MAMMAADFAWGTSLINDLPDRLRFGTRDLHTAAERTGLMAALLAGRIERATYCALLRSLFEIYEAMEAAPGPAQGTGPLAVFDMAALRRTEALAADLDVLHGQDWREGLPPRAAALFHAARVRQLAEAGSCALVAHAYVRYLGDLHGGQLLKRRVTQALALNGEAGVAFYEFGPVERVAALRQGMRVALGHLRLSEADVALIVDEARWAFAQHLRLFVELQADDAVPMRATG